jgi:hypothetical protein
MTTTSDDVRRGKREQRCHSGRRRSSCERRANKWPAERQRLTATRGSRPSELETLKRRAAVIFPQRNSRTLVEWNSRRRLLGRMRSHVAPPPLRDEPLCSAPLKIFVYSRRVLKTIDVVKSRHLIGELAQATGAACQRRSENYCHCDDANDFHLRHLNCSRRQTGNGAGGEIRAEFSTPTNEQQSKATGYKQTARLLICKAA